MSNESEDLLQLLLEKAALFRFLARGFAYPRTGWKEALLLELAAIPIPFPVESLTKAWEEVAEEALQAEYTRVFMGQSICSLHETSYGDARRIGGQSVELADIGGFYKAFGLEPSPVQPDLPDHLCSELEFYSLLLAKEAYALDSGWEEQRAVTGDAVRAFMEYHLGRWVPLLVQSIEEQSSVTAYHEMGRLLLATVKAEWERLAITPQLADVRMSRHEVQEDVMICPREEGEVPPV